MFKDLINKTKQTSIDTLKNAPVFSKKLFEQCKGCNKTFQIKELKNNLYVCPDCDYHFPITSDERINHILDSNSFVETNKELVSIDPLNFPEYKAKLEQDIKKTNLNEAIITGTGRIDTNPIVIGVMDSRFRMGSMGSVVGEKITRAIEEAIKLKIPFVLFSTSGGARMQEGILSLMQMAKTSVALEQLNQEKLLFISVMTNPTTGGVSASFASLGDINIGEPKALIGFAGRRIIEQTIKEDLPDNFQTAEFLLEHGQLDLIIHRKNMKSELARLLKLHSKKGN